MIFLFVGSSGLTEASFPRDLAIPQLLLSSACVILLPMKASRMTVFPHRGFCTPSAHAHVRRTQNHWSERGRATSVGTADALGRPRRSVLPLGRTTPHDMSTRTPKTDSRLLGTWRSDRLPTVTEWRFSKRLTPERRRKFLDSFGHLRITYTRTRIKGV